MKTFLETSLGYFFIFQHKCKLDNKMRFLAPICSVQIDEIYPKDELINLIPET